MTRKLSHDNVTKTQIGSELFTHELYLIEITKYAESIVVDSLTFTNDIDRNYAENAVTAMPIIT
jgi:hypothetical protein